MDYKQRERRIAFGGRSKYRVTYQGYICQLGNSVGWKEEKGKARKPIRRLRILEMSKIKHTHLNVLTIYN